MPFDQPTPRTFTPGSVQMYAPVASGVYGISSAREWIYIGETEDIQGTLMAHLRDLDTPLMKRQPTGFVFEVCGGVSRSLRQDRLVLEYVPVCNGAPRGPALWQAEQSPERKITPVKTVKLQFVLTGFTHDVGVRVFAFERIGEDRIRTKFTVRADLGLARKYGIHVQELPLLCRSLLDRRDEANEMRILTFSEEEMLTCATDRAALAKKRKPQSRPTENPGAVSRG